jgi:Flp pilus assembly pilin Flp
MIEQAILSGLIAVALIALYAAIMPIPDVVRAVRRWLDLIGSKA